LWESAEVVISLQACEPVFRLTGLSESALFNLRSL